ncbi:hypothetical protein EDD21DRAFT_367369 [Dissophora ornata]|nr:hypothetical protein EDD21DRAFT_367369 [Dissophora ornata]
MTANGTTPPSSSDSTRASARQQQPFLQQHQPFPSSTSSFSIRHSTYTSSLLGPNDSTRISALQGTSDGSSQYNGRASNFERRVPPRFYSLVDPSAAGTSSSYGAGTQSGNGTARIGRGLIRPRATTVHEAAALLQDSSSDLNSLYTVDNTTPSAADPDDSGDDGVSYFGSAGQDYLLKQKRARRSMMICWLDLIALIVFTIATGLHTSGTGGEGRAWDWGRIAWSLTTMAVVRILVMTFTARYVDGNYNAAVIFVCVSITLVIMFEVNMIIQQRIELSALTVAQYCVSVILTQLHWISYSTHTPMSAALEYAYDPLLSEGITFSRESRYIGAFPSGRVSTLRHGTSYGTLNSSRFDAVLEQDEELEDDQDMFIKVDFDRKATSRRGRAQSSGLVGGDDEYSSADGAGNHSDDSDDGKEDEDEDQDMATLLALQDARRQQVYISPTASPSVIPARSFLSPQAISSDSGNLNRTPLSLTFQGNTTSYDMRLAAGASGASAFSGGLTIGYTPRKRSLRSNMDPNGTGRRTWTGGHNIIYSGIFVEDSDEEMDQGQGAGGDSDIMQDDDESGKGALSEHIEFDDTIKAEYDDSKVDQSSNDQLPSGEILNNGQSTLDPQASVDGVTHPKTPTHLDDITEAVDDPTIHRLHPHFRESTADSERLGAAIDAPEQESSGETAPEGLQHHVHGLSTLRFHVSSHKDITAVMCEEDNCSEHQFQEGPAAELENAIGERFTGGNIVQLDIKEDSTSAVEIIGDGINNFEDSSLPSTIRDMPHPRIRDSNGTRVGTSRPITTVEGDGLAESDMEDHGSREVHLRERIERTRLELEMDGTLDMSLLGSPPGEHDRLDTSIVFDDEQGEGETEYRRIHLRERIERITVGEEGGIRGNITQDPTATARPGHKHPSGTVGGGVIVVDDPSTSPVPEQWVQIQDADRPTGVITWGIVDDIPQSLQEGIYLEPAPEPRVYIPPQRTAIVDPPQPRLITVAPPPEPLIAIDRQPRQIVVPRPTIQPEPVPRPVLQPQPQPRMIVQPQPQPLLYTLPPRPVIVPPQLALPPAPIAQPSNPIYIAPPQPTAVIQPQPQLVVPTATTVIPQSIMAPAQPLLQPEYGTYETIVPGVPGGAARLQGGAVPLNRGYSAASIYDNRSIVSIYDDDVRSAASVYNDRTIVSINELEGEPAMVPIGGPIECPPWMRGQPLPAMTYGRHLASAAHMPSHTETLNRHLAPSEDMSMDRDLDMYVHSSDRATGMTSPKYEPHDNRSEFSDSTIIENRHEARRILQARERYQNRTEDMEMDSRVPVTSRHEAFPSDSANTELSYQKVALQDRPAQLQELAIETYFDTTKSQLKVREQQGQLLSEMALQLKKRQQQIQEKEQQQQQSQHVQREQMRDQEVPQQRQYLPSPPPSSRAVTEPLTSPVSPVSSLSQSLQQQQSPPTLNIPRPPLSPPPVRLLANRGVASPFAPAGAIPMPRSLRQQQRARNSKEEPYARVYEDDKNTEPILSTSSQNAENIMLQARHQKPTNQVSDFVSITIEGNLGALHSGVQGKPPLPDGALRTEASHGMVTARKTRKRQHIPPMSRHHLHPALLQEGVTACWNNEFGAALETFKEHAATYPRWSLAAAEVHIVRELISGQLSEADSELMDALQLSEKVASRVLDRKQEFDASFMGYRTICSADASIVTANDNTLRQNYKWDCEMAFYDTLLYRGILQLTSSPDTKGTFSDIKGGLQLRRAWKGYMRIKQEMESTKDRWQKLTSLVQSKNEGDQTPTSTHFDQNIKAQATGEDDTSSSATLSSHLTKNSRPGRLTKTVTMPIAIPTTSPNAPPLAPGSKKATPLSTSHPSEGSRWSIFGKRSSWSRSAASLSSSPTDAAEFPQESTGSTFLSSSPSAAKGLASMLRDQTKAAEDIKTAVKVLEDIEDYMHYGIGLFYFILSVVPKSLLPALRTIGLQTNHEQGIKNLEAVFARKNARAPFAALFLSINYLFLSRGMNDPSISLGRAGEIVEMCLKTCPNGSSYLLMACHHARKTGNIIPAALNHITRGIQTCEAAGIPSINYRFELGLTFFINQEFDKAADIFEILWRRFITTMPLSVAGISAGTSPSVGVGVGQGGRRRKGRSQSMSQSSRNDPLIGSGPSAPFDIEDDEEDEFELAPFCGLCLIASKVVVRIGQEGYFEYGRDGFGHHTSDGAMSPTSGILFDSGSGRMNASGSATPMNLPRPGPDFDLLVAAQEVLVMMSGPEQNATVSTSGGSSIFEHSKAGSSHSIETNGGKSTLLSTPAPPQAGKLNRFNKFAWNQCQKSLQHGRISPFLPLVILYLRRDLAYMKPVLLRKYRTLLETIWKSVQQTAEADTQAIYLLLSAVVHRQLLPDDATFAYTALTDCLLLESAIESEMWVIPHCHYELGELLYKKLHLPQAALEQFQWIVKGPGKEARPASIFYASASSIPNPRLSVFGGGYPSDTVTNIVESVAATQAAQVATVSGARVGGGHSNYPSSASGHRLSQLFPTGSSALLGSSPTHVPTITNPQNPLSFYNSRYKKFEFSQALRHRSSVCVEQIQAEIEISGTGSAPASRRTSVSRNGNTAIPALEGGIGAIMKDPLDVNMAATEPIDVREPQGDASRKRNSAQSVDLTEQAIGSVKSARVSTEPLSDGSCTSMLTAVGGSNSIPATRSLSESEPFQQGWSTNTLPNILSDAQRKRGSLQQPLRSSQSTDSAK